MKLREQLRPYVVEDGECDCGECEKKLTKAVGVVLGAVQAELEALPSFSDDADGLFPRWHKEDGDWLGRADVLAVVKRLQTPRD